MINFILCIREWAILNDFSRYLSFFLRNYFKELFWWTSSKYIFLFPIKLNIVNIPSNTLYIIIVLYYKSVSPRSTLKFRERLIKWFPITLIYLGNVSHMYCFLHLTAYCGFHWYPIPLHIIWCNMPGNLKTKFVMMCINNN